MITQKDLELIDSIPKLQADLKVINLDVAKDGAEEEKRREEWTKGWHAKRMKARDIMQQIDKAGEANQRLHNLVDFELRRTLDQASVAVRATAERIARARTDLMSVEDLYARRQREDKNGGDKLTRHEVDMHLQSIDERRRILKEEQDDVKKLEAAERKAQAAVDAELARLRKGVKK